VKSAKQELSQWVYENLTIIINIMFILTLQKRIKRNHRSSCGYTKQNRS